MWHAQIVHKCTVIFYNFIYMQEIIDAEASSIVEYESQNGVTVYKLGRLLLFEQGGQQAYFIDITDRVDPEIEEEYPDGQAPTVGELMRKSSGEDIEGWCDNNGIVVLVTSRYANDGERRVYIGLTRTNPDDEYQVNETSALAQRSGIEYREIWVPMSDDPQNEKGIPWVLEELRKSAADLERAGKENDTQGLLRQRSDSE
jgi:hypothetical protein